MDRNGKPLSHAKVTPVSESGEKMIEFTDKFGKVSFDTLSAGEYTILIENGTDTFEQTIYVEGVNNSQSFIVTVISRSILGNPLLIAVFAAIAIGNIILLSIVFRRSRASLSSVHNHSNN